MLGLIGNKLSHSISPQIHQIIQGKFNLNNEYKLIELSNIQIDNFFATNKIKHFKGLNVTIPYKKEVIKYLDTIDSKAEQIGAINTIKIDENIKGYNTDYYGIDFTFRKHEISLKNKKVLILGTGGVAKCAINYLLDQKISELLVVTRDKNNISKDMFKYKDYMIDYDNIKKTDIIINCTPVGMFPNVNNSPLDKRNITNIEFLFDMIYNPLQTKLLSYANDRNIKYSNGLFMLTAQAFEAERIWFDIEYKDDDITKTANQVIKLLED